MITCLSPTISLSAHPIIYKLGCFRLALSLKGSSPITNAMTRSSSYTAKQKTNLSENEIRSVFLIRLYRFPRASSRPLEVDSASGSRLTPAALQPNQCDGHGCDLARLFLLA